MKKRDIEIDTGRLPIRIAFNDKNYVLKATKKGKLVLNGDEIPKRANINKNHRDIDKREYELYNLG